MKQIKTIPDAEIKTHIEGDNVTIEGYANTKNQPDAYGHIPTSYKGQDVYDLSLFQKNPILLVDHNNSSAWVAGKMLEIREDEKGLFFKAELMKNPKNPNVAHAIEAYKEKIARGISIGGNWAFDDPKNRNHLTKAVIHEISLVGVGADPNAVIKKADNASSKAHEGDNPEGTELTGKAISSALDQKISELRKGDH